MAMLHLKAKNSECKSIRNFLYIKVLLMLSFSVLCKKSRRGRYKVRGDMVKVIRVEARFRFKSTLR